MLLHTKLINLLGRVRSMQGATYTRVLRNRVTARRDDEIDTTNGAAPNNLEPAPRPECWHGSRLLVRRIGVCKFQHTTDEISDDQRTMPSFFFGCWAARCWKLGVRGTRLSHTGRVPCRWKTGHGAFPKDPYVCVLRRTSEMFDWIRRQLAAAPGIIRGSGGKVLGLVEQLLEFVADAVPFL